MRVSRLLWRYGLPVWALGMLAVLGWVLLAYQGGAVRSLGSGFIYALLVGDKRFCKGACCTFR